MSYYRDVYLKSEDWKNLRAAAIAIKAPNGKCWICRIRARLDVHHIQYRKLYDVRVEDLVPLCRTCHDKVHVFVKKNKARVKDPICLFHLAITAVKRAWKKSENAGQKFAVLRYKKRGLRRKIKAETRPAKLNKLQLELKIVDSALESLKKFEKNVRWGLHQP